MGSYPPNANLGSDFESSNLSSESASQPGGLNPSLDGIRLIFRELEQPENLEFKDPLTPELMQARILEKKLSRYQSLPSKLVLDDTTMRMIRQYSVPPTAVHDVVVAFFLLLGEYEGYTRVCAYLRSFVHYCNKFNELKSVYFV